MDEYIRKVDAVDTVPKERIVEYMDEFGAGYNSCRNDILGSIESLTPADVAPVVHAKWEHVKHKSIEHGEVVIDGDTVRCSACRHAEKEWHAGMNFCPNCGAKMEGGDEHG